MLTRPAEKILGQLAGQEREALVTQIKSQLVQLKRFSYGKQIIAIEKLIFDDQPSNSLSTSSQSSTLPSTNASTVEGSITSSYHNASISHETQIAAPLTMGSTRT
jgi:mRNA-binding protein PUF3